jgi:hypothetical protein
MSIPRRARISITFTDYWLGGTGGSGKGDIDVAAYRDDAKCPAMPMTQIKGTLRETARDHGVWDQTLLEQYFGKAGEGGDSGEEAAIRFAGDATLEKSDHDWFDANDAARTALFSRLRSTALNEKGVARNQSLRTVEVCHPCTIVKEVDWVGDGEPDANWIEDLNLLCQLTFAFGRMKNDGLGRATASCEAVGDVSGGEVQTPTGSITLTLIPEDAASFSRHNATEGVHQSHAAPPGSALWGWAISKLYGDDKEQAYDLFHSGKVRFSDAVPLIGGDIPAFPNPMTLLYAKHDGLPLKTGQLDSSRLSRNRDEFSSKPENAKKQAESLKGYHISLALNQTAKTGRNHRLRTAHMDRKAEDGKLFGTEFVKAAAGYRATIESDDPEQLKIIATAFPDGGRIFLGRARSSGYGGAYTCKWEVKDKKPWPAPATVTGNSAALWCLSDIALVDDFGMPCFEPTGSVFGLYGWTLDLPNSSINTRRFAPWNRTEGGRSSEICVIEAGSVLCYKRGGASSKSAIESIVGLYKERGFGRVTLMPEFGPRITTDGSNASGKTPPSEGLQTRAQAYADAQDTAARDAWLQPLLAELPSMAKAKGAPSKTQWSHVRNANHASLGVDALRSALGFDRSDHKPLDDKRWQGSGLRAWLMAALSAPKVANKVDPKNLPDRQLRFAVDQIVKTAKEHAPKGDGGDRS